MTVAIEPRTVTVEGAAKLARAGLFAGGELIGVTEHGHAIYAGHGGTIIARCHGVRPEGVHPYRDGAKY